MNNSGPLKGVRVLDLSRVLAGPMCGQLLGDLAVRLPSASGGPPELADRGVGEENQVLVLGGLNHLDVVNHPRVYEQIKAWCSPGQDESSA